MNMERKTGLMNKKYVSPCFLPGMRLGNIMFTLAASTTGAGATGLPPTMSNNSGICTSPSTESVNSGGCKSSSPSN